jgi:hypothetical protein
MPPVIDDKNLHKREWLMFFTSLCLLVTAVLLLSLYTHSCSTAPKTSVSAPGPAGAACPDGSPAGATRTITCPGGAAGSDTQVCSQAGQWVDATNTCGKQVPTGCSIPTYADVQPLFQTNCSTCHSVLTSYTGIQNFGTAEIARRVGLPPGDPQHMPQGVSPQLTPDQVQLIQTWVTNGVNQTCPPGDVTTSPGTPGNTPPPSFLSEDYLLSLMNSDALNLLATDRPFTRYLVVGHAINNGATPAQTAIWTQGVDKTLNSIAVANSGLTKSQPIDPQGAVIRIDLRSYGINAAGIAAIEAGDVNINIIDNTSKGQALQALIGTKKPWFHADNFIDIVMRNSAVYYKLTNTPPTLAALQAQIGVNFNQSLQQFAANFIGSANSPIAEQKNRLIVRVLEARNINNAYFWQTFDVNNQAGTANITGNTNANTTLVSNLSSTNGVFAGQQIADANKAIAPGTTVVSVNVGAKQLTLSTNALLTVANDALTLTPNKNLFKDPLINGTGGVELFNQDASEVIWQLQNGMQGYALFDAAGNLLNAADPNVVIDTETPLANKVINNANSCPRCHNGGIISMQDQVLASTLANASQFVAQDVQLVKAFYQSNTSNAALFKTDQAQFAQALHALGIDPNQPDPQNVVTDQFLLNWNMKQAASFLFLTTDQMTQAINTSPTAKNQIGALLTPNGTVTFAQFTGVLQQLIKDANLFQDPVGNGGT